jgi:hypothetical protein
MQTPNTERIEDTIDVLSSLLRGEISAVETYRQAEGKIGNPTLRATLATCRTSHETRVQRLREKIVQLGGKPPEGSGPWGAFAKLVEGGAKAFGDRAAIAALEEGEDKGMRDYRDAMNKLSGEARIFVENCMIEQERTHQSLSATKKSLH